MLPIGTDHQRLVEEDLFSLPERYAVELPPLFKIPIVPIKAGTALQRVVRCHGIEYISEIYVRQRPLPAPAKQFRGRRTPESSPATAAQPLASGAVPCSAAQRYTSRRWPTRATMTSSAAS